MNKIWNDVVAMLEKEVSKIVMKNDISPSEIETLYKVTCICEMICKKEKMEMEMFNMNNSEKRFAMTYDNSNRIGRGPDGRYTSMDGWNPNMPNWNPMMNNSMNGMAYGNQNNGYNNGVSNHSIEDRIIANMEHMMDGTNSEYERQQLQNYIQKMRNGN
jgi:hypothetical protein